MPRNQPSLDAHSPGEAGGDARVGQTLTIDPSPHAGHTVTVESRDAVEKHKAYWLRCECGETFLLGEHWLDIWLRSGQRLPWDFK